MNRLLTQRFSWKTKNSQVLFQPLLLSFDSKRQNSWSVPLSSSFRRDRVKCCCYCLLWNWRLETSVLSDVLLALGFALYSSSRSGSLASGAIWFSSTLRRYWYLAMKYCMCWDVALRRWETLLLLAMHTLVHVCYFLVQWCVFGVCACASCLSVAVYLILVFFSSLVSNLKPTNGVFQSLLPNCSDTLMR